MHLYLHIPFCKKKCNYCDFVSYAGKEHLIEDYVEALIKEATTSSSFLPISKGGDVRRRRTRGDCQTIYFGGGTPTLLKPKHFDRILTPLIPLSIGDGEGETRSGAKGGGEVFEISIEANPGTADKAKLKALRQLGINRLSIGVQSFDNKHLKNLGRIHSAEEAIQFYKDAREAGFDNINIDLIFALPNQTLDEWKDDLRKAIELEPDHLSAYNLQIEEGTPLYAKRQTSNLKLPNNEEEYLMYKYTIETLTNAGYKHYEISNFAKNGFECRHNITYWENRNYLGVGSGAHSHWDGKRWANANCIEKYINTPSSFLPLTKGENVERSETRGGRSETIFMGLRLLDGLQEEKFNGFEKELNEMLEARLLAREKGRIKLTRKGLYLANEVFAKFV